MSNLYLAAKLVEMDHQISDLRNRIRTGESMSVPRLEEEVQLLKAQIESQSRELMTSLEYSKAEISECLSDGYCEISAEVDTLLKKLREEIDQTSNDEKLAEKKLLLAEYALDFSTITSNIALLLSMDAILEEKRRLQL